jgi:VanZ family protein
VLLFVGGPDYYSPRSHQAAWGLGHDLTFFLWTLLLIRHSSKFARRSLGEQLLLAVLVTVPLGFAIEWLQTFVGRSFSVGDVARDLNGSGLAIVFLSPATKSFQKGALRTFQVAAVVLILIQLYPVATTLVDEIVAKREFPILSDLETPFEISRWSRSSPIAVDHQIVRHGRASLRVRLMPAKYSSIALRYFPSNWQGYSVLSFSIRNPSDTPLRIICRVHDQQHIRNGQQYTDRFNKSLLLLSGWNDINIDLKEIRDAPRNRRIDLSSIAGITFFAMDLPDPKVIYIDDVRLSRLVER